MNKLIHKLISIVLILSISFSLFSITNISAEETSAETTDIFSDLAFPTAEGFGANATAWRGGRVITVTNLNDSGEGSLRWALEEETGPRIIVFKVGGVIELDSSIVIGADNGQVYIAGQTAPGDGITITKRNIVIKNTSDVIVRDLRIRTGDDCTSLQCISVLNSENVILDHCSFSWGFYGCVELCEGKNISVQNCIIAEGLYQKDTLIEDAYLLSIMSAAFQINAENATFHHNLITHCNGIIWFLRNKEWIINPLYSDNIDIRNNVVYNATNTTGKGFCDNTQMVSNYYKKPAFYTEFRLITSSGMGYLSGNKAVIFDDTIIVNDTDDQLLLLDENAFTNGLSTEPLFNVNVTTETADEAYENVLKNAGANIPRRDYIDSRYITEVTEGTYTYGENGIIKSQSEAGGYPDNTTFTRDEAPIDTDNDGMPDDWENEHGLDPNNYYDACQVYLSDEGYTNIELYINELARDPVHYSDNPTIQYTPPTATPKPTDTPEPTEAITDTPDITETPEVIPSTGETEYFLGDVNADSVVNAKDALEILKHAAKLIILTDEEILRSDVDKNELINASDALAVLKIAAKL